MKKGLTCGDSWNSVELAEMEQMLMLWPGMFPWIPEQTYHPAPGISESYVPLGKQQMLSTADLLSPN